MQYKILYCGNLIKVFKKFIYAQIFHFEVCLYNVKTNITLNYKIFIKTMHNRQ